MDDSRSRNEDAIVVIGAGPAGLAAALALRSLGRPVKVFEAGEPDRLRPAAGRSSSTVNPW